MGRVNISVPDEVIDRARQAGLNVSRVATAALVDELDRREKVAALDAYLAELEEQLGPVTEAEERSAAAWADQVVAAGSRKRRRSA